MKKNQNKIARACLVRWQPWRRSRQASGRGRENRKGRVGKTRFRGMVGRRALDTETGRGERVRDRLSERRRQEGPEAGGRYLRLVEGS